MRLTSIQRRPTRRSRPVVIEMGGGGACPGTLLLVFALDRATGATPVQHLYYLPIIFAGLRFGMPGGFVSAVSAIVLYHVANPHLLTFRYEESDLVQIVLFLAVGW